MGPLATLSILSTSLVIKQQHTRNDSGNGCNIPFNGLQCAPSREQRSSDQRSVSRKVAHQAMTSIITDGRVLKLEPPALATHLRTNLENDGIEKTKESMEFGPLRCPIVVGEVQHHCKSVA